MWFRLVPLKKLNDSVRPVRSGVTTGLAHPLARGAPEGAAF